MNSKLIFLLALTLVVIAVPKVKGQGQRVAVENDTLNLRCASGNIVIQNARYGKPNTIIPNCAMYVYGPVANSCAGKQKCSILAADSSFGGQNPCPGVTKVLDVYYRCE